MLDERHHRGAAATVFTVPQGPVHADCRRNRLCKPAKAPVALDDRTLRRKALAPQIDGTGNAPLPIVQFGAALALRVRGLGGRFPAIAVEKSALAQLDAHIARIVPGEAFDDQPTLTIPER
jgi:hypothetical protein